MGVRLPAEYQEVVSLWSDTNQYIDTGIIADNETGFFVDAQKLMNNNNDAVVIGSRENSGSTRCWIDVDHSSYDGRLIIGWNGYTPVGKQQAYISTNRFTASVNYKNTRKVFINGAEHAPTSSQLSVTLATQTHSLYLFGANYAGKFGVGFCGRIFACKISKGITIIADYVPCYRKADNKPGMYDLISQSFLTNQGTGEFQADPDVIDSISSWLVARRRLLMRKPLVDTSPRIAEYGKRLFNAYGTTSAAECCYTEFYDVLTVPEAKQSIALGVLTTNNTYQTFQSWDDEKALGYGRKAGPPPELYAGTTRVRFTLVTADIDDCYVYNLADGQIWFAGKNTIYYGYTNINDMPTGT